jgi:hypothetical protein
MKDQIEKIPPISLMMINLKEYLNERVLKDFFPLPSIKLTKEIFLNENLSNSHS